MKRYIQELPTKYAPESPIANVPSAGDLAGRRLHGQMFLEVPVQKRPVPRRVLDAAKRAEVKIRDINGLPYE